MTEILTTQEAADLLRVTAPTVRGMVISGEIPGTKIGDDWRFVKADLIACISERAQIEQARRKNQPAPVAQPVAEKRSRGRPRKALIDLSRYQ